MTKYFELDEHKKHALDRNVKIGMGLLVLGGLYVLHRRKLNAVITVLTEQSQAAIQDTMWKSFDEGVKYGLTLEKTVHIVRDGGEYAFGAFDKAS